MPNKKRKKKYKFKYKVKWKNVFKFLSFIFIIILLINIIRISSEYFSEKSNSVNSVKRYQETASIMSVVDDENTIIIPPTSSITKFDSYWQFIKLGMINVNFEDLGNQDIGGWLQIKNTNINIPVMYGKKYKEYSIDNKKNRFGSVYTESISLNKINTISSNSSNVIFKDIKVMLNDEWKNESNNYIIKYVTREYTGLWQILSITKNKSSKLNDINYYDFIDKELNTSLINFNTSFNEDDIFLFIDNGEYLVCSKLLKYNLL